MIIKPIIPIWIMSIICILMIILKRKKLLAFLRQLLMVALLFVINLRVMVPDGTQTVKNVSMDVKIVFVIDDTLSMVANDYSGEQRRLDGALNDCSRIVEKFNGAKFSIVTFHNTALISSPMTNNIEHINGILTSIEPIREISAKGTSFDSCRDLLASYLPKIKKKDDSKVLVYLLSDGELNNDAKLADFSSLREYVDGGAVLGYGTQNGAKMYAKTSGFYSEKEEYDYVIDKKTYEEAISKMDEGNLKKIADDMGVSYVNMNNAPGISEITDDFVEDLNVDDEEDSSLGYKDTYYYLIPVLIILIFLDFLSQKKTFLTA